MTRTRRRRGQRGTALVEVTWLSILLLVPLVYVVLAVFEVQRSAFAVNAATRAAGRAYTLAPSEGEGAARARGRRGRRAARPGARPARRAAGAVLRPRPARLPVAGVGGAGPDGGCRSRCR